MTRRYVLGMLPYVVAFALAFVSSAASLALIVILPEPNGSSGAQHPTALRQRIGERGYLLRAR
jgi:hypothetical protein